jgi:cell filamentation protein
MPFDPFGDFATRGYLRNFAGEKDPEAVKHLEHHSFAANILSALENLKAQSSLRCEHVLETHRILFGSMYPWAGQDRAALAPELAIGKGGAFDLFAHPGDVRRAVEYGLEMGRDPRAMREKPGEVLGTLAYAHPLLENNGRTIITVHTDMARRAGFHIAWHEIGKKPFLDALTAELRQPGSALDGLIAPYVRNGSPDLSATAAQLGANPGINPVSARGTVGPSPGFS